MSVYSIHVAQCLQPVQFSTLNPERIPSIVLCNSHTTQCDMYVGTHTQRKSTDIHLSPTPTLQLFLLQIITNIPTHILPVALEKNFTNTNVSNTVKSKVHPRPSHKGRIDI